jgi:phosphoglycerate dehydrogenase-like enzyme
MIYHEIIDIPQARRQALGITQAPFEKLLADADIVTVHVPLTASTRHMLDAKALGRMKRTAFLINTARGGIVDEQALVDALRAGRIAGAALDVFEQEPSGANHPLYAFPNVVLTPHVAAGTRDAFATKMGFIFQNLEAFFDGKPVENLVDYAAEMRGQSGPVQLP